MPLSIQFFWLLLLALPVACVVWTVTHEEIFSDSRSYCIRKSKNCEYWFQRKFFYLFTCEYCFSHYIAAFFIFITEYKLLLDDWRGYLISFFAVVFIANVYMSLFAFLRQSLKLEKLDAQLKDTEYQEVKSKSSP